MGREIRQVPPHWEHPAVKAENDPYRHGGYQPMHNQQFTERWSEWLSDFDRIRLGNLTDFEKECYSLGLCEWLQYEGTPPNPDYYRPYSSEEATWFQIYETVSEGTPVTPPFATKAELVNYLATNGDFWDQKRGDGPWKRSNAEKFVGEGWAPSMIVTSTETENKIQTPRDGA